MVAIAKDKGVVEGRKMRVDTTVVETNIHFPTDSSLLGDGVRVLTRIMKKITAIAGAAGAKLRDRSRSVKLRVLEGMGGTAGRTNPPGRLGVRPKEASPFCARPSTEGEVLRFAEDRPNV